MAPQTVLRARLVTRLSPMPSDAFVASADTRRAWRLPVELLLLCLLSADILSRIRASHVCHAWREAAIAERRLWGRFSCTTFRDKHHQDAMFALLQAMLLRSRSLPFDLEIPFHYHDGDDYEYRDRLLALEQFDIHRLVAYHGPARILSLLNPSRQPLPALLCLDNTGEHHEDIELAREFGPRCLTNLRRLIAPHFSFPVGGSPFLSLASIITSTSAPHDYFYRTPNLSRLEITDTYMGTALPRPPLPPSLQTIVVRCEPPQALDFVPLVNGWRGIRVRHIVGYEMYSLHGVIPLFLAWHTQPTELRVTTPDDAVSLAALPDDKTASDNSAQPFWTIHPSPPWAADFLGSIEKPASNRLRSISVSFARLGALLRGKLNLPGLEKIEICLCGAQSGVSDLLPVLSGDEFFLRAPSLRRVAFTFDDEYAHSLRAHLEGIRGALATLGEFFCAKILYDVELLDEIIVSRQIEHECAGYAHFAKAYIAVGRASRNDTEAAT